MRLKDRNQVNSTRPVAIVNSVVSKTGISNSEESMSSNLDWTFWSRRQALGTALGAGASIALGAKANASKITERDDLRSVFQSQGVTGTFALYDAQSDELTAVDAKRAATRYVPASTFKIANSLIALETGVVKDENEVIPYGGKPQPFKAWERTCRCARR